MRMTGTMTALPRRPRHPSAAQAGEGRGDRVGGI